MFVPIHFRLMRTEIGREIEKGEREERERLKNADYFRERRADKWRKLGK